MNEAEMACVKGTPEQEERWTEAEALSGMTEQDYCDVAPDLAPVAEPEAIQLARVGITRTEHLGTLRRALVAQRCMLEEKRRYTKTLKADVETQIIEAAGGDKALGANEAARERALMLALAHNDRYDRAVKDLVELEGQVLNLAAMVESEMEALHARNWLIDALLGRTEE